MMIWFILVGIVGGVLGGMGMGGGTLLIPLLVGVLGFAQFQAQTINLIAFLPMALVAIVIHSKNHLIEWKKIWWLVLISVGACIGGAMLLTVVNAENVKFLFGLFLIVLAVFQFGQIGCAQKSKACQNDFKKVAPANPINRQNFSNVRLRKN